jgi:hypothetical protein
MVCESKCILCVFFRASNFVNGVTAAWLKTVCPTSFNCSLPQHRRPWMSWFCTPVWSWVQSFVCCVKANSHIPCRAPAILRQCSVLRESPLVDGNIRTASLLLVTTFVLLRIVAGRSRTRAGRPHAVSGRPMLIHTYAVPIPLCTFALSGRFQNGLVVAWQGNDMACVNQKRPHCVNPMGKTQSKPITERHGRGTAWGRYGMCELA